MKQIDNMQKKVYTRPAIEVVNIDPADLICTSGEPRWYDDELD